MHITKIDHALQLIQDSLERATLALRAITISKFFEDNPEVEWIGIQTVEEYDDEMFHYFTSIYELGCYKGQYDQLAQRLGGKPEELLLTGDLEEVFSKCKEDCVHYSRRKDGFTIDLRTLISAQEKLESAVTYLSP